MKKFKKVLSLVLVLAMVVGFMPMMEKVAKAEDATGFYAWYLDSSNNLVWESVGNPVVSCENFISISAGASTTSVTADNWTGVDNVTFSGNAYKVGSTTKADIVPTCAGTINIYWLPRTNYTGNELIFNGEKFYPYDENGEVADTTKKIQVITQELEKGVTYTLQRGAGGQPILCMITFTPTQISSAGIERDGYYKWSWSRSVSTPTATMVGSTVASVDAGVLATSADSVMWATDYSDAVKTDGYSKPVVSLTNSEGDTTRYDGGFRFFKGSNELTFSAPCDGTLEVYLRPYGGNATQGYVNDDLQFMVNGKAYGDTMTSASVGCDTSYAEMKTFFMYEIDAEAGEKYTMGTTLLSSVFEVVFKPNAVSTLGASYRETTAEHGNGIRFGSTIDKTSIDYANVTESGTLIALKSKMKAASVEELTMDEVGKVCIQVKRTTYLVDDESTLNYAAAIVNIPENAVNNVIVARPYVVIDDVVYYGAQMENSLTGVQAALNN